MIIDILLISVIVVSAVYILALIVRKFPQLATINIKTIPEEKQNNIRRQILEEKLRRDLQKRWRVVYEALFAGRGEKITSLFRGMYGRLREMEHEYRVLRGRDLVSDVAKARSIDELLTLAREAIQGEQYQRAEQLLFECLKVDEHNIRVYRSLSELYRARREFDHAKETLEFIVKLTEGRDPSAFEDIARLAYDRGDLKAAREGFERCIELDQTNYKYYLDSAEANRALEEYDKAQERADRALMLAPNNPKILDFLIENSIILQDKVRAHEYLTKLTEVNPQNGKIKSFRERVASLADRKNER